MAACETAGEVVATGVVFAPALQRVAIHRGAPLDHVGDGGLPVDGGLLGGVKKLNQLHLGLTWRNMKGWRSTSGSQMLEPGVDLHAPLHLTITSNISTDRIVASHGSVAPLWTDNDSGPGRSNKGANA